MKYILSFCLAFIFSIGVAVTTPSVVLTQSSGSAASSGHIDTQTSAFLGSRGVGVGTNTRDARSVVANIIRGCLGVLGVLFVAYAFYGGMMILTAAGDEDKVEIGKSSLRTATIGVVVVLSALAITQFVVTAVLSGTGATPDEEFEFGIDPNRSLPLPPEDPTRGVMPSYPSPF